MITVKEATKFLNKVFRNSCISKENVFRAKGFERLRWPWTDDLQKDLKMAQLGKENYKSISELRKKHKADIVITLGKYNEAKLKHKNVVENELL